MAKAYYIPSGTMNLQTLFPSLKFSDIAEYYLELEDDNNTVIATTPKFLVCGCEDTSEVMRIHFLNSLGAIDAINFQLAEEEHQTTSEQYRSPTTYPLVRAEHAGKRFNVAANDVVKVISIDWGEKEREWLDELLDTPAAWLEWKGEQGQGDDYIPILILDANRVKVKREDRFIYEIEVQFTYSHDKFLIRN